MKTIAPLLLAIALPVLASGPDERPISEATPAPQEKGAWPQFRDIVYVAARLEWIQGLRGKEEVQPCAPLTIFWRNSDSTKFGVVDDTSRIQRLLGPGWLRLFHQDREACLKAVKESGEPRIRSTIGMTEPFPQYRLVSDIEARKKKDEEH